MKYFRSPDYRRDYARLPKEIKAKAKKAFELFLENPRHPGLQIHKIKGTSNPTIWEGYISRKYRFTFRYEKDAVVFRRIGPHKIIDEEARS